MTRPAFDMIRVMAKWLAAFVLRHHVGDDGRRGRVQNALEYRR